MANLEKISRVPKVFRTNHAQVGGFSMDYMLLPIGFRYNDEWLKAKAGDKLYLTTGGEHIIRYVRKLPMKSTFTDILCRVRYGMTLAGVLQRWQLNASLEGHGKQCISTDECLWVVYEKDEEE
jgi:hypothetical protein